MSIYDVFDKLQQEVENGGSVPLTAKVMIDKDLFLDLLDELREMLPPEVIQAQNILDSASSIIQNAKHEAEIIVNEAHARREEILEISSINKEAQQRAEVMLKKAKLDAYKIRAGSLEQSYNIMDEAYEEAIKAAELFATYRDQLQASKESLLASVKKKQPQETAESEE
ncbi:MAG: hypothetical protein E7218_00170 [Anaerofustis stercorihominis]|nr:hypothetical protein [Anaerofustis stercorihominis]